MVNKMDRKRKFMICGIVLVLLAMPFALSMLNYQTTTLEGLSAEPIRNFGLSTITVPTSAVVTNLDDTDNLYCGGYKDYIMTVNITDDAQSSDIANVTIIFTAAAGEFASFQWLNTTNVWAELTGTDYLRLTTGTNTTDALKMDVTITFKLEWACPDTNDVDIVTSVGDIDKSIVNDTAGVTYDFDSDLTLASDVFFTYAEEGQNELMAVNTLTYSYEDSLGDNYPLAAETDFWVSRTARVGSLAAYFEAASYVDGTGVATWNPILSTGGEHTDTFTLYAVTQAGGSSGTTLMDSTHTDTISVIEGSPGVRTPRTDDVDVEFTYVQAAALLVAVVVLGGGAWYYSKGSKAPRKRTTRKRKPASKRKPRRKR